MRAKTKRIVCIPVGELADRLSIVLGGGFMWQLESVRADLGETTPVVYFVFQTGYQEMKGEDK